VINIIAIFLITFRETLEASLIIGIMLAYLKKTKNTRYNNIVYIGIFAGIFGSFLSAFLFNKLAGGFTGRAEEIFEGVIMLVGSILLTSMILWMMNQKHVSKEIENKILKDINRKDKFGLFMLVFFSVLREGVETVIFLGSASLISKNNGFFGGILGIGVAMFLGYLIFVTSIKIDVKKFFNISSLILIFFAAGLTAHGIHELQEAKIVPTIIEHVWDVNPKAPIAEQGIYPALHENGAIGSIGKGLFGYNGNPSLIEVISYLLYLGIVFFVYRNIEKNKF
jgi:high-affinity iron transporter